MGKKSKAAPKVKAPPSTTAPPQPVADVLRDDVASLALVRRTGGRTAWAFTERAHGAPPMATMVKPLSMIEEMGRFAGADPEKYWWWITDEALDGIAAQMNTANYCVLDHFLGRTAMSALRTEVAAAHAGGRLELSRLAGGRTGHNKTYSHTGVRGDHVGWFDGEEAGVWPRGTLSTYLTKIDTLIAQLGPKVAQLAKVASRSKAMVACYPGGGARYVRHCDNSCHAGKGERCNGRRLTVILYLNDGWAPLHGGELRLYEPYAPKGKPPIADVAPLADRLILFYADYRVPHEVLPAHAERYAVTTWYFDKEEHTRARSLGAAADQTDNLESEQIENEIAKFEQRFGREHLVRHGEDGDGESGPTALAAG